jgi:hypothetical protein
MLIHIHILVCDGGCGAKLEPPHPTYSGRELRSLALRKGWTRREPDDGPLGDYCRDCSIAITNSALIAADPAQQKPPSAR